ncbi:peptide ligase PGM1-related protein [Streptomyces huiliensis]|uniref:preATP grasp domain-containing protein n=1 Tax=Streptomyces huiliensis TaxID=2876027 RepID=UPI001CBCABBC|nr:peptide ligase PGM1-related protein [Streptomyces huiliensis]MBZ4322057.1 hypothetical protein [Streptomyces huiliensis]
MSGAAAGGGADGRAGRDGPDGPVLVLANRLSKVVADTWPPSLAAKAVGQSPRKVWLLRPGDLLVAAVPVPGPFLAYAAETLGFSPTDVRTLAVPQSAGEEMTAAVRRSEAAGRLLTAFARRPGARLLPYALDEPVVRFAAALGIPVHPYGPAGVGTAVLTAVRRLNTKSGFRSAARSLGITVPPGDDHVGEEDLPARAGRLCARGDVLVKPARSANGYGILRLPRGTGEAEAGRRVAAHLAGTAAQPGGWVVEERVAPARDVSVQAVVEPGGARILYDGEMRVGGSSFHGYRSPARCPPSARAELAGMALSLGRHLAGHGYLGPFSVDALLTPEGRVYAVESNVRRTGTTTPHALVHRLGGSAARDSVWIADTRAPGAASPRTLGEGVALLRRAGLAYDTGRGRGALVVNDPVVGGGWSYLIAGPDGPWADEAERRLRATLSLD